MRIVAVYSFKGGVGKTATAVNLAWLAAEAGARVLLVDLDPQGAATFTFRIKPKIKGGYGVLLGKRADTMAAVRGSDFEGLDVLPADFSSRTVDSYLENGQTRNDPIGRLLRSFEDEYDQVIVDCGPTASRLADSVFSTADHLVIPTIPTTLSLRTLARLMKHLKAFDERPAVHPFFCMVDLRKQLHRRVIEWERAERLSFLQHAIPYSSVLERMSLERAPVFAFSPRSKAAQAYRDLWQELCDRFDEDVLHPLYRKRVRRAVDDAVRSGEFTRPER